MRLVRNAPCPCGSGRNAKGCCGRALDGDPPATAEALMRSRYVAYAVGDVAYILTTTHPDSPHQGENRLAWEEGVREFSKNTRFFGVDVEYTATTGTTAVVQFYARLERDGADTSFRERSRFAQVGGRWLYIDGVVA